MRFQIRVKKFGHTFFMMLATTQTLEGVTSVQPNNKHIIMFDLEKCSLEQAEESLGFVQGKHGLPDIFIVSDAEDSYRGWCFSKVDFKTLLKILLDVNFLDWNFFYWTVSRSKATLRTSDKQNRQSQKVVSILKSYPAPFPESYQRVVYDTGIRKRGMTILLGG